jgi:hypothetical protein
MNNTHPRPGVSGRPPALCTNGVRPPGILLISPIAEMQRESVSTLVTGPGADNAGRIRVVE